MSEFSIRTYTWQDLADETVGSLYMDAGYVDAGYASETQAIGWQEWIEWTGNGTTIDGSTGFADLVYTSPVEDLGVSRTFYPTASVRSNGTGVTIAVQISADGSTGWSTQTLGAMTGRYIRFVVTVVNASATARLDEFEGEFFFDFIQETFDNLSISASGTTLPIANTYSGILGIRYDAPINRQVVLTDVTKTAPKVISYDMDTWGRVATATTANVTVIGFPNVAADSFGNIGIT